GSIPRRWWGLAARLRRGVQPPNSAVLERFTEATGTAPGFPYCRPRDTFSPMRKHFALALAGALLLTATLKGEPPVKNPTVVMKTSLGSVTIELYPEKAPETVKNFLQYVNDKFYDGTIF